MIEITSVFREASKRQGWNQNAVGMALDMLSSALEGATVDWERGDEEWGRVILDDAVTALVCAKVALVVLVKRYWPQDAIKHLRCGDVSIIEVDALDYAQYLVDREVLEEIFDRPLSENVNFEQCSINDLWWATV